MTLDDQIRQASLGVDDTTVTAPIKLDLGGGEVLEFKNQEDLSSNLRTALGSVNQEVTNLKQQLAEYQAKVNTVQNQGQYATSDSDVVTNKFDVNTFIEQMREDPRKGFDYVDQYRDQPYKRKLDELESMKQEYEAQKFRDSHPEFPGGKFGDIIEATRQELGLPFNKVGLDAAYAHAQQQNRMPNFQVQSALQNQQMAIVQYLASQGIQLPGPGQNNVAPQQQYIQQQNPYANQGGIPTVPRNQANINNQTTEDMLESMPLAELEKLLRRNGALV